MYEQWESLFHPVSLRVKLFHLTFTRKSLHEQMEKFMLLETEMYFSIAGFSGTVKNMHRIN